jgi:hypothetical protein
MVGGHDTATLEAFSGKTSGSAAIEPFLPVDSPPRILAVER